MTGKTPFTYRAVKEGFLYQRKKQQRNMILLLLFALYQREAIFASASSMISTT